MRVHLAVNASTVASSTSPQAPWIEELFPADIKKERNQRLFGICTNALFWLSFVVHENKRIKCFHSWTNGKYLHQVSGNDSVVKISFFLSFVA